MKQLKETKLIRIKIDIHKKLKILAAENGLSLTEMVEKLIKFYKLGE